MSSKTNIRVINEQPARERLRAIFANRWQQAKNNELQIVMLHKQKKMKYIVFGKPSIAPQLINGVLIDFPFSITQDGIGYEKDKQSNYNFRIGLSAYLLLDWGENIQNLNEDKVFKMAYPFAESIILEKINDGTLKDYDEKVITTEDNHVQYPYDLDKVSKIENNKIEIESPKNTIGEIIETNQLADEIVQLRDNINTLFHDKYKETLLFLNEERGILNFFRKVQTEEEFTHRLASLGELIKNMNSKKLLNLVDQEENNGSISLLEIFIKQLGFKNFEVINIFRKINRIRQGFPIHTDKAGIISSLKYFDLNYPIENYKTAWNTILISYRNGLKELKEIISKDNAAKY